MTLLAVERLSTGYRGTPVIRQVSLELAAGEVVALIGPNGHGKTTLLRALSGLLPITGGRVLLEGRALNGLKPHRITAAGISHVPQGDRLFQQMTVMENLQVAGDAIADRARYRERLERVFALFPKLKERRDQIASSLSGGERRMVGIGRGLMLGGRILVLDEPSLGLAPIVVDQIYEALSALRAARTSILLVEENPERAAALADRIYMIHNGRLVWSGDSAAALANPELVKVYLGG